MNTVKTEFIIIAIMSLLIPAQNLAGEQEQVNAFGEFVSINTDTTVNRCYSSNGQYWCEIQFSATGFDYFQVSEISLYKNQALCTKIIKPKGTSFYISNIGLIAAITTSESLTGKGTLAFYKSNGAFLFETSIQDACDYSFSENGNIFAFKSISGVTLIQPDLMEVVQLKSADIYTLSPDGAFVALYTDKQVIIYENHTPLFQQMLKIKWPRKMAFSEDGERLAIIGRNKLVVLAWKKQQILFIKDIVKNQTFRDVKWDGQNLKIGVQQHLKNSSKGSLKIFDINGRELNSSEPTSKQFSPNLNSPQSLLKSGHSIPWPLSPFDQPCPLGNSYEEYQDYGGDPYPHPGIDMLAPAKTSVYSISNGFVKTILTTEGQYHWRIAIGDSSDTSSGEAWLYAHLILSSIPWAIGDTIEQFEYLGQLVPWPISDFSHLHFARIRKSGLLWTQNREWDTTMNPLTILQPDSDNNPPVFYTSISSDTFAFCKNESSDYLKPDSLYGEIDIISHVGDHIGHPEWECSIYRLEFDLTSLFTGKILYGPFPSMTLSHIIPKYTADAQYTHILYKNDDICNSEGDYTERNFFMILTNSDGDSILEYTDANASLNTRIVPDGPYRIQVRAFDEAGNMSKASMNVEIQNGNQRSHLYSMRHKENLRSYLLHVPPEINESQPVPLVIALHGGFGNGLNLERMSGLSEKADSAGFIVAYPDGLKNNAGIRSWNAGTCCGSSSQQNVDDVGFIESLIQLLISHYPIDTTRIYATGISNGGMMCYRLASELSETIAAIAPVAATMVLNDACSPVQPVPVLHIHSILDQHVPFAGGYGSEGITNQYYPSVDSVITVWSNLNGCMISQDTLYQGSDYVHIAWRQCLQDADVELYLTDDGGHSWPGGEKSSTISDEPSNAVRANDVIWSFFFAHPLHNKPLQILSHDDKPQALSFSCYPNPFNPSITIFFTLPKKDNVLLTIYDILGREVEVLLDENQTNGSHTLVYSPRQLSSGVYFCRLKTSHNDQIQKIIYMR